MSDRPLGAPSGGSKYDYVKVRVWLANDHYYILSRYLVARQLTAATAPPKAARRAAAALKKSLVDGGRLDISAAEMEAALADVLGPAGVPTSVRDTYATVARFAGARRGLLVAVAGAPWSGAPRVAARLAAALNLAAPAHTDLLSVALRGSGGALPAAPPWARRECDLEAALDREARVMRAALQGELDKCARDGRSTVLEGALLDPSLYVAAFDEVPEDAASRPRPSLIVAVVDAPPATLAANVADAAAADPAMAAAAGGVDALVAAARKVGERLAARARAVGGVVVSVEGGVDTAVEGLHREVLRVMVEAVGEAGAVGV